MAPAEIPPLLGLPNKLLEQICKDMARISHHELLIFSLSCKDVWEVAGRVTFRTIELLMKANTTKNDATHYARLGQDHPSTSSRRLETVFLNPTPRFLEHTKSLSFHCYWKDGPKPDWMVEGFGRLMLKPSYLRRLEIDGNPHFAMELGNFLARAGIPQLAGIDELCISLEFSFLLMYRRGAAGDGRFNGGTGNLVSLEYTVSIQF